MTHDIAADPRLDPRLKDLLSMVPQVPATDVDSREALVAEANSEAARKAVDAFRPFMDLCDTEEAAPSAGLRVHTEQVVVRPRRQHHQPAGHPARRRRDRGLRVLHPRRRHVEPVLLRRDVPGLGQAHRRQRRGRRHGRLPQLASAPPRRPRWRRSRPGSTTACRDSSGWPPHAAHLRHRPGPHRRRRRERRRQPDPGHRAASSSGTATSAWSRASTRSAPTSPGSGRLPRTRRRPRTTASCSTCTTTGAP